MVITKKMIRDMSQEDKRKLAAAMISPKRCGGLGSGTCVVCGETKATYEKLVRRASKGGRFVIAKDIRDTWVCIECRVAKGEYERYCDDCNQKKPAKHAPFIRWHWWCDDCTTPWRDEHMEMHEATRQT